MPGLQQISLRGQPQSCQLLDPGRNGLYLPMTVQEGIGSEIL